MTELERVAGTERECPPTLLQRLRRIEPLAELAYIGDGEWWLGRRAPNSALAQAGREKVRAAHAASPTSHVTAEAIRLWRVGRLQQEGFVFIASYEGEPDGRIEQDLEVMDFLWKAHATQQRWEAALDADARAQKEAAHRDLTDEGRARDAYNYAFKGSFAATRIDARTRSSARTLHTRLS